MSWWQPVTPGWVRPCPFAVHDAHVLAYRAFTDTRSPRTAGIVAALSWVRGGRDAPITARTTQPVTREIAGFEQWAAIAVVDNPTTPATSAGAGAGAGGGGLSGPPLEGLADMLGVPFLTPRPVGWQWAAGVHRVLRWLNAEAGVSAPVPIPHRHPDGRPLSSAEIRERHIIAAPQHWRNPDTRAQVEARAEADAQLHGDLLALLDTCTDQFGPPPPRQADEQLYTYRPTPRR